MLDFKAKMHPIQFRLAWGAFSAPPDHVAGLNGAYFLAKQLSVQARAGSVSVFGVGIGIRYFRRYFFHVGSVSVFLKNWLKIANFWYTPVPPLSGAPVEGDQVGISQSGPLLEI